MTSMTTGIVAEVVITTTVLTPSGESTSRAPSSSQPILTTSTTTREIIASTSIEGHATSIASTNTSPFFPDPSTYSPPPDPDQWRRGIAKTVFALLVVIVVVVVILILAFKRYLRLKHTNQAFSCFFPWCRRARPQTAAPSSSSTTPLASDTTHQNLTQTQTQTQILANLRSRPATFSGYALPFPPSPFPSNASDSYPISSTLDDDVRYPLAATSRQGLHTLSPHLPGLPYSYTYTHPYPPHNSPLIFHSQSRRTRTRAVGTDDQGRRLDSRWDPDQFDFEDERGQGQGEEEDKEVLPVYDCFGGPPKYADVEVETENDAEVTRT